MDRKIANATKCRLWRENKKIKEPDFVDRERERSKAWQAELRKRLKKEMFDNFFERVLDRRDGFDINENKKPVTQNRHQRRIETGYYKSEGYAETVKKYRKKQLAYQRKWHASRMVLVWLINIILLSSMHSFVFKRTYAKNRDRS